jgi:HD superfamily phosphohydrolase
MTEIRDPVHGYVKLDNLALKLLATPQLQRLRWIKQRGLANLVYPGANHSRLEHSLGVYHLAGLLADQLGVDGEERLKLCAAALLHDIGHGPLSHATESVFSTYLRREHESIIDTLKRGELRDVLDEYGIAPQEIQRLIMGETALGQIVNSEIDVDRMDYLMRDAHYTGVAYGVIDHLRLIEKMKIHLGNVVIERGGLQAAESLLVSRLLMHPTVYFHHVCRIAECMIESGISHMIDWEIVDPLYLKNMDDTELFSQMSSAKGYPAEMIGRIKSRKLFKRAVYLGYESLLHSSLITDGKEKRIAEEIADASGVDSPSRPEIAEVDFSILIDGETKPMRDFSPLVMILERAHRATWRFGVYTTKEERERVSRAARRCLNLKKDVVQYTLADV